MFHFDSLLLTAVYPGIEVLTNICEEHHYHKKYTGLYGPLCYNLRMLLSQIFMFSLFYFSNIIVN